MNAKVKILFGLEAVGGGALKHLTYLVTNLDSEMFDITVVFSSLREDSSDEALGKIRQSGAKVIFLPIRRNISILHDLKVLVQLMRIIQIKNFDIIHAHSSKAGALLRVAAFLTVNPNVIYTPHCFYFQSKKGWKKLYFILLERILSRITRYLIVSIGEKHEAEQNKIANLTKLLNINNAIDFNENHQHIEASHTLQRFSIPEGRFIVGAIGRLTPQKDWETYIFMANEVLKTHPEVIFLIVGEGELKSHLEKLIFSLGLEKKVILTGFINEIHNVYGIMDVFVSTSLWEGLPYVFLEAMKYKKTIIATDRGESTIVDHEKNGFITPVKDYRAIAQKVKELIEDKQKTIKMGEYGYQLLFKKYSFDAFMEAHRKLYMQLSAKS